MYSGWGQFRKDDLMKKVLLIDAGHQKGGNSEIIVDAVAADLKGAEVSVFKMREKNCKPCMACAAWTVSGFSQMGAEQFKSAVFDQIPERGDVKNREDYMRTVHELAGWLAE